MPDLKAIETFHLLATTPPLRRRALRARSRPLLAGPFGALRVRLVREPRVLVSDVYLGLRRRAGPTIGPASRSPRGPRSEPPKPGSPQRGLGEQHAMDRATDSSSTGPSCGWAAIMLGLITCGAELGCARMNPFLRDEPPMAAPSPHQPPRTPRPKVQPAGPGTGRPLRPELRPDHAQAVGCRPARRIRE